MSFTDTAHGASRVRRAIPASALLGLVALLGAAVCAQVRLPALASQSGSASASVVAASSLPPIASPGRVAEAAPGELPSAPPNGSVGLADGLIPEGTSVFDDSVPGIARLDPDLLTALRRAARAAADEGIRFVVNSGWRSAAYEEQLFRDAVSKYGSETAAARWVATAETSPHVSGDAVDLGPAEATRSLLERGARFGLCQIYRNEPWHYELRPAAVDEGCPAMFADPTRDPRMRR